MSETKQNIAEPSRNYGAGIHKTKLDWNEPFLLIEIEGLARDGYDDQQIAEILNVNPCTFSKNKNKKQEKSAQNPTGESNLSQALKKGRRPLAVLVENSLFKRATGMSVKTTTVITKKIKIKGMEGVDAEEVMTTETTTELAPETAAMAFYLKNHKPDFYNRLPINPADENPNGGKKGVNDDLPRITKIEHVTVSSEDVEKIDADV